MPDPWDEFYEDDEDPAPLFAAFDAAVSETETVNADPRYV